MWLAKRLLAYSEISQQHTLPAYSCQHLHVGRNPRRILVEPCALYLVVACQVCRCRQCLLACPLLSAFKQEPSYAQGSDSFICSSKSSQFLPEPLIEDMEAIAIIGCIAAVVSAYRDGGVSVDKIKQKRLARQAPPPPRLLEDSLARGPRAVEEAKVSGVERFRDKYADKLALDSLKDILIDLQGSLIRHLRQAQEDDNMNDFTTLVDASDIGRIRTVTVLNDLYVRVAKANIVPQQSFRDIGSFTAQQQDSLASSVVSQVANSPPAGPNNAKSIQHSLISAPHRKSEQPKKEQPNPAKTSFLDRFRRKSSSDDNSTPTSSRRSSNLSSNPDPAHPANGRERNLSLTPITSPQATIDEDNPWATEDTRTITAYSEILPNESFSRAATLVSNNQPRPSTTNRLSTTPSVAMLF